MTLGINWTFPLCQALGLLLGTPENSSVSMSYSIWWRSQSAWFLKLLPIYYVNDIAVSMPTGLSVSPNVVAPSEEMSPDIRLWRMGKQQRNLLFLPHSKQHELSSQKHPSFTDSSDLLIAWWAHRSSSLSGLYSDRYIYWFLKTNNSLEWEYLRETHMKWRMP